MDHPQIFAYTRSLGNQMLLVINNFYSQDTVFKLPDHIEISGCEKKILISNYKDSSLNLNEFTLRPYESVCYLLEKNVRI